MSTSRQATTASNCQWFADNGLYEEMQSKIELYRRIKCIVEAEIKGSDRLLDIGNGGFFNFDTDLATAVTAVDLFLKDGPGPAPNTFMKQGSFLDLPFAEGSFDVVMQQNVLHHVTGCSVAENFANMKRCVSEMYRCLAPGGKALLIESTVNPFFNAFECLAYRFVLAVKKRGHQVTFQYTPAQVAHAAKQAGFQIQEICFIPRGRWILQFGHKWPAFLTPARPIKAILRKPT